MPRRFYITTPIYYVNDRPHIGHVYTTTIADIVARYHRLAGDDVFFLTGVDEHAAKVSDEAAKRGLTPQQWADQNAQAFRETFAKLGISNNDFVRTTEERHKTCVQRYVKQLVQSGDVYLGEYEGWYDAGQEEYVSEGEAEAAGFKSPINGKPLVRRKEPCYYFKLSKYQQPLLAFYEKHPKFVQPDARRNEIVNRVAGGLQDVPISRTAAASKGWGIPMPDDAGHTIYVWIDALFNYYSYVDTDERRGYWPAQVHLIAKDILWFHAAIWPALLMSLEIQLPGQVYSHSFWISEGQKMSKSLGNFIDLEKIDSYVSRFSLDALRYFLASQGPLGTTDSDFAEAKFIEVYNTDLANTLGNCFSRISNMTNRYFGGKLPDRPVGALREFVISHNANTPMEDVISAAIGPHGVSMRALQLSECAFVTMTLVRRVDGLIESTQPFKLAKEKDTLPQAGAVLYTCAEVIRIASLLLWPIIPAKAEEIWRRLGCDYAAQMKANGGRGDLEAWTKWGQLQAGTPILQGDPLFMRHQVG